MIGKILIVEDEFIVASDLRMILEKAGYQICGIAPSVPKALEIINLKRPALVFLDIQLVGKQTGIDLAKQLSEIEIPFIFVSANSNQSILEAAKATKPDGFLVKPFRERDVLVALDIALYRHEHNLESRLVRENMLQSKVTQIIDSPGDWHEKALKILRAFHGHIPFDYHAVRWESNDPKSHDGILFIKDEHQEFDMMSIQDFVNKAGKGGVDWIEAKILSESLNKGAYFGGREFDELCRKNPFKRVVSSAFGLKSGLIIPVSVPGKGLLTYSFYSRSNDAYGPEHVTLLERLGMLLIRIANGIPQASTQQPVPAVPDQTAPRSSELLSGAQDRSSSDEAFGLVGTSNEFVVIKNQINLVAPFEISVLILGESGTGKERIAQAIHRLSNRKGQPLIKVNCGAIPANLMESELFGHEKGAFTGAMQRRLGRFEQANGGTIFLDEIGELPPDLQVKLLCVLQEREIVRLGGNQTIKIDVRVIAATNRNLEKEVAEGRFRLDLFYRLNVFPMTLPPLRERKEDIPLLVPYFLKKLSGQMGKKVTSVTKEVLNGLMYYDWPGNIRELENLIERGILLTSGDTLNSIELPQSNLAKAGSHDQNGQVKTIKELEKDHILAVLKKCNGKIAGAGGAAELLDLAPTTLLSKMNKLGIVKKFVT